MTEVASVAEPRGDGGYGSWGPFNGVLFMNSSYLLALWDIIPQAEHSWGSKWLFARKCSCVCVCVDYRKSPDDWGGLQIKSVQKTISTKTHPLFYFCFVTLNVYIRICAGGVYVCVFAIICV